MPNASNPIIELNGLTKRYGDVVGIKGLSLQVFDGEIFALLGPNGAGKTTTIRLILDFIRPTSGNISVFGLSPQTDGVAMRQRVGYLPGDFVTYNYMTGATVTEYLTNLRGTKPVKLDMLCERFKLDLSRKIADLSKGNRQKIGLVQAFMNDPDLLILDEPTSGLDPLLQHEFQEMLREEKEQGKTVFLSSHVMSEVEATCDRVCIIREGELVTTGTISELTGLSLWTVKIAFSEPIDATAFDGLNGVTVNDRSERSCTLSVSGDGAMDGVIKTASKYDVVTFESEHASLEDAFLQYYSGDDDTGSAI